MTTEISRTATDIFERMRTTNPLVQCITNYVAMNYAANVLLAAGASPAMVHTPEESGEFATIASALTVNIGTLSPDWVEGMIAAAKSANDADKPWVLDPVAHFATSYRRDTVAELLKLNPTVIRGNASEIIALAAGKVPVRELIAAIRSNRPKRQHAALQACKEPSLPSPARLTL